MVAVSRKKKDSICCLLDVRLQRPNRVSPGTAEASFVPVTRDANNDVYLLDPSAGEGAKLVQWVKERSTTPPPLRIDGHEVVLHQPAGSTTDRR